MRGTLSKDIKSSKKVWQLTLSRWKLSAIFQKLGNIPFLKKSKHVAIIFSCMSTAVTNAAAKSKGNLKDAGKPKIWYQKRNF